MSARSARPLGGTVAFLTAVGCATAVVDQDPGFVDPNAPPGAGATGGSSAGGTTGGTAPGTGGTAPTAGTNSSSTGGGAGMLSGGAGRTGTFGGAGTSGGRGGGMVGGVFGGAGRSAFGMGGEAAAAGTSSSAAVCPDARMPLQPGMAQGNSGSFDTTEAVCFFVEGSFNTWNCSNLGGRTVSVNGTPTMCGGALPDKIDGGYYFEFGASTDGTNYTSFYWYTS